MWSFQRLANRLKGASTQEEPPPATTAGSDDARAPVERRKDVRLAVGVPTVVVLPGDPSGVRALIRDISKGGCLLDTTADVKVGALVSLAFLGRPKSHCRATGRVVRKAGTSGFGVEFSQANLAFVGFVGFLAAAAPESRGALMAAMRGSTIEVRPGP
jgi:hypothetical protein